MNATGNDETTDNLLADPLAEVSSNNSIHLLPRSDLPLRPSNKSSLNPTIKEDKTGTTTCTPHPTETTSGKTFRCKYCSLSFLRMSELLKHLIFHTGDTRNQCKQCKLVLSSHERLVKHKKTHDVVSANFQCDMCGVNGFESKRKLASHIRQHVKDCNKKFERLSSTDDKDKVNETFNCELCKKQFSRKSNFMAHVRKHCCNQTERTTVKTVKTHLCCICGKLFSCKNHLIRHLHIHNV